MSIPIVSLFVNDEVPGVFPPESPDLVCREGHVAVAEGEHLQIDVVRVQGPDHHAEDEEPADPLPFEHGARKEKQDGNPM